MNWCRACINIACAREPQLFLGSGTTKMRTENFKNQVSRWVGVRRRTGWLVTLAVVLAVAFAIGWSGSHRHQAAANMQSRNSSSSAPTDAALTSRGILPLAVHAEGSRKVFYPYSVIPGGIQSIEELKSAMERDPVVAAQYAAFRLAYARIIRLDQERTMHVTYRRGDQVYWTQRELLLAKGETLITDGSRTALTRCGNLIAETIEAPSSPNEPTPQELNTPVPNSYTPGELESDNRFPDIQFVADPYVPPTGTTLRPGGGTGPGTYIPSGPPGPIPYPGGSTPHPPGPTTPPIVRVPEPGTAVLLLAGLLVLLFIQMRKPKNAPKNVI
jgi:hypothetical protein